MQPSTDSHSKYIVEKKIPNIQSVLYFSSVKQDEQFIPYLHNDSSKLDNI